jgi:trigger factor
MFGKTAKSSSGNGKAEVKDSAPCQKSIKLTVGADAVEPIRAAVTGEFQRQATLSGFRKGKAPAELIQKQYAREIEGETRQRVMQQALEQVTKEHELKPVGPFEIAKADFAPEGGLSLEATVEVEPDFALGSYAKIPLTKTAAEVTPADVEQALGKLRESMAQMVPAKGGEGAAKDAPKERQLPALDDEMAKDLGYETLEKLRAHVAAKLGEQKRAAQAEALEQALFDEMIKRHPFELPARLVAHQGERLTQEFKARLLLSGLSEEQAAAETSKFTDQLRTNAERRVRLSFILDRVAEQEKIGVTQDELMKRLWNLSRRWQKDPAEVRRVFDRDNLWPSVVSAIRQEKTVATLLSQAAVKEADGKPAAPTPTTQTLASSTASTTEGTNG